MVEKKEVQTSGHEVPRDAKDDSKDSNASSDVLLVPTVEEVIHFGLETSSCSYIGAIFFGVAAHFPFSLSH